VSVNGAGPLLDVQNLVKTFRARQAIVSRVSFRPAQYAVAVDGVSFSVKRGETLGLVGESGSGKTTVARCVLRLLDPDDGSITFDGLDVSSLPRSELQAVRRRMQMVFQDPYSSLNPRMKIGTAIAEPALVHKVVDKAGAPAHVKEMLELVGLPANTAERYPRQLSGGQRQRIAIARALSSRPSVLIADEPVSALDVSVQAQILNLLSRLHDDLGLTMLFIAHQLSVVRHISNRVAIMYLGRIVETGPTKHVFDSPQHPYTKALLDAAPLPDPTRRHTRAAVRGDIPSPFAIPPGCRFHTRCAYAVDRSKTEDPVLEKVGPDHYAACHVLPFRDGDG
jgi:oligopeptide/dipeptide ABC transporter ATP-binding protein